MCLNLSLCQRVDHALSLAFNSLDLDTRDACTRNFELLLGSWTCFVVAFLRPITDKNTVLHRRTLCPDGSSCHQQGQALGVGAVKEYLTLSVIGSIAVIVTFIACRPQKQACFHPRTCLHPQIQHLTHLHSLQRMLPAQRYSPHRCAKCSESCSLTQHCQQQRVFLCCCTVCAISPFVHVRHCCPGVARPCAHTGQAVAAKHVFCTDALLGLPCVNHMVGPCPTHLQTAPRHRRLRCSCASPTQLASSLPLSIQLSRARSFEPGRAPSVRPLPDCRQRRRRHWLLAELPAGAPHPSPQPGAHAAAQGRHRELRRDPLLGAAAGPDHPAERRLGRVCVPACRALRST